ncbi:MAG: hypothetical protein QNJ51_29500 [Calothrix sp. MO_167.B12]|nr:hypothetical protein [Calothrix sp. MO_167.B12]
MITVDQFKGDGGVCLENFLEKAITVVRSLAGVYGLKSGYKQNRQRSPKI